MRGNLAAGGLGVAQPLTRARSRDRRNARRRAGARGLLLVGLDAIGDYLTEVNVTSPTCFHEIMDQTGFDVAGMFIDALERAAVVSGRARLPRRSRLLQSARQRDYVLGLDHRHPAGRA